MPNYSPVTSLKPEVPTNALSDALADFDRVYSSKSDTEECDFLAGDEHPELELDESGW